MKLQFSSIPYSPTIGHGNHSVRLVEFDQKVTELFRPWSALSCFCSVTFAPPIGHCKHDISIGYAQPETVNGSLDVRIS